MQWRFWDFARNGFRGSAWNDSAPVDGRSAFQDMVDRRLAQLSDGGTVWRGFRENKGDAVREEHGPTPLAASPGITVDEGRNGVGEIASRYDPDKWNSRFDPDARARWLNEERKVLREYQQKHAAPEDKGRGGAAVEDLPEIARPDIVASAAIAGKSCAPAENVSPIPSARPPVPAAVPDIDLPEGFDNVGTFELN